VNRRLDETLYPPKPNRNLNQPISEQRHLEKEIKLLDLVHLHIVVSSKRPLTEESFGITDLSVQSLSFQEIRYLTT